MIGLALAALAILACGLGLVALAVTRLADVIARGVSMRGSLDVRPGADDSASRPRTAPRERLQTHAAPRARGGAPKIPPPPEDTWDGTTPTPDSGVAAPQRRSGDS